MNDLRIKLLSDVGIVEIDGGALLRNKVGTFTVKHEGAFRVLCWIADHLDGTRRLSELLESHSPVNQPIIRQLIATLIQRGFARALQDEQVAPDWGDRYADQLDYLEHTLDEPLAAFQRFRAKRILIAGNGATLKNVLACFSSYGAARLDVLTLGDGPTSAGESTVDVRGDDGQHIQAIGFGDAASAGFSNYDAVFLAADERDNSDFHELRAMLAKTDAYIGELGAIGPRFFALSSPTGHGLFCWDCLEAAVATDDPEGPALVAPAAAAMGSHYAVFHYFRNASTGEGDQPVAFVVNQLSLMASHVPSRSGLGCSRHALAGLSEACLGVPAPSLRKDVPLAHHAPEDIAELDEINRAVMNLTHPVVGPLLRVDEGALVQVPLAASQALLRLPGRRETSQTIAYGFSARECHNQVVLAAVEHYVAHLPIALAGGTLQGGSFGFGWNISEALFRAVLNQARQVAVPWVPASFESSATKTWRGRNQGLDYLLALYADKDAASRIGLIECANGIFWARLLQDGAFAGTAAGVGANAIQAVANLLLDHCVRTMCPATPAANVTPVLLSTGATEEEIDRFTMSASKLFDIWQIDLPQLSFSAAPVGLAVRRAKAEQS